MLARIYLYKEDWENALIYAKMVLSVKDENDLMGIDSYIFNDYTTESLFEISIDSENSVGSNGLGAQFDFRDGGQGDAIEGVTHSVCTLEFAEHQPLYNWFLENLPVPEVPRQYEFSRLNVNYLVTSKRKLKQ